MKKVKNENGFFFSFETNVDVQGTDGGQIKENHV